MNRIAQSIKNRLSLRPPQADSLNIRAELTDRLTLKKHTPNPLSRGEYESPLSGGDSGVGSFLQQELEIVKSAYPTCTDFCSRNKRCYLSYRNEERDGYRIGRCSGKSSGILRVL